MVVDRHPILTLFSCPFSSRPLPFPIRSPSPFSPLEFIHGRPPPRECIFSLHFPPPSLPSVLWLCCFTRVSVRAVASGNGSDIGCIYMKIHAPVAWCSDELSRRSIVCVCLFCDGRAFKVFVLGRFSPLFSFIDFLLLCPCFVPLHLHG